MDFDNMKIVKKDLSKKVLMIGEYFKNSAPGGMAAVLASYDLYFEDMKFIPTWKDGGILTKIWFAFYSYVVFVWKMLTDKDIRIIHIQGAAFASFERNVFFVRLGKWFGKKVIMHMHCADFASYFNPSGHKQRILDVMNACDMFFVLSDQWADYFESIGVRKNIIVVLNNTIAPPVLKEVERNENKVKLLYLGIIGQRKGVYDLLKVLNSDKERYVEALELHIGGNQEEEKIKATIKDYGVGDFVTFEGFVKGENKINDLNWADIFILPSYNEGLPIAILEAMSYGMPIISTNVGGIPVVVRTGENGQLIEPGNLEQIKSAIDHYLIHRDDIAKHGEGSKLMVKPFLPETVFETVNELYYKLLE